MKKLACLLPVAALLMLAGSLAGRAAETETKKLVLVGFPDPYEWLTVRVVRRIAREFEAAHPDIRVELQPGPTYMLARKRVLSGEAMGMMLSEERNRIRAYKSQTDDGRPFRELKLDRFVPVFKRIIRSREEVLAERRIGIATDRITPELKAFMDFLSTDAARRAAATVPHVEVVVPARQPTPVTEVRIEYEYNDPYRTVTLQTPILSY